MNLNVELLICWVALELAISFDGDVHFRKFFHRWKALTLSFRSVQESLKMDITIKSYCDFESTPIFLKSKVENP